MASKKGPVEVTDEVADREAKAARLFATLGSGPLTRAQAERVGQLLDMHWTSVYRLRRRFVEDPVASSVAPRGRGPKVGGFRIEAQAERVMGDVLEQWLPKQKQLAHPLRDLRAQVRLRCERLGVTSPSRNTIVRRWKAHQQAAFMAFALDPRALIASGELTSAEPLGLVQIDHTLADVIVVDERSRERWKRPWLSVALGVIGVGYGMTGWLRHDVQRRWQAGLPGDQGVLREAGGVGLSPGRTIE